MLDFQLLMLFRRSGGVKRSECETFLGHSDVLCERDILLWESLRNLHNRLLESLSSCHFRLAPPYWIANYWMYFRFKTVLLFRAKNNNNNKKKIGKCNWSTKRFNHKSLFSVLFKLVAYLFKYLLIQLFTHWKTALNVCVSCYY